MFKAVVESQQESYRYRQGDASHSDQGQSRFRIVMSPQMSRRFRQDQLKRRTHGGLEQMAGHRGSIALANDDVSMQLRLSLWSSCNITDKGDHLDLLLDWNLHV